MTDKLKARAMEWLRNEAKYGTESRYAATVLQMFESVKTKPTEELPYISSHRLAEWAVESARQPGTWEEKAADFLHENTLREASGISIDEMYALCLAIERIQASEEQTFVSVNAARLLGKLKAIVSPLGK